METDIILFQCAECGNKQKFSFIDYNRNDECVICDKCHAFCKIDNGLIYGRKMTEQEYREYKFIQKLKSKE